MGVLPPPFWNGSLDCNINLWGCSALWWPPDIHTHRQTQILPHPSYFEVVSTSWRQPHGCHPVANLASHHISYITVKMMSLSSWIVIRTYGKKVSRQFAEWSYISHHCSLSYMYTAASTHDGNTAYVSHCITHCFMFSFPHICHVWWHSGLLDHFSDVRAS